MQRKAVRFLRSVRGQNSWMWIAGGYVGFSSIGSIVRPWGIWRSVMLRVRYVICGCLQVADDLLAIREGVIGPCFGGVCEVYVVNVGIDVFGDCVVFEGGD